MTEQNDEGDTTSAATVRQSNDTHSSTDDSPHPPHPSGQSHDAPPKKKRKVNHACVYCRRSHMTCDSDRPCKRCIKRNIGHLCHDEPRETAQRKSKGEADATALGNSPPQLNFSTGEAAANPVVENDVQPNMVAGNGITVAPPPSASGGLPLSSSMGPTTGMNGSASNRLNFSDQWLGAHNQLQGMHRYHPNYMFNANEVTDEYNLLNDFLSTSLYDEAGMFSTDDMTAYNDPSFTNSMHVSLTSGNQDLVRGNSISATLQQALPPPLQGSVLTQSGSIKPVSDKAREKYYMTAADPSGTDPPEERMNRLLKAKYDAGMLKPFNYVNGYARLNRFMEKNMKASSRHKILMQLDRFRPKFRERMQSLTDIELVLVEMWFERSLMEYDRIFASMAIPACCWRRTGEVFRGNKEMAELIHVPIESLREGKLAIHDFIVEDQLVSYWEKFCAICFDQQQKAMLTSCTLRSPTAGSESVDIHCCFSFTIRRDNHNIPSLIIGNFLPSDPIKH